MLGYVMFSDIARPSDRNITSRNPCIRAGALTYRFVSWECSGLMVESKAGATVVMVLGVVRRGGLPEYLLSDAT